MAPVKEVEFERTFDAPVETVWKAWTQADELKKWWGPEGVIIPECDIDPRVGGRMYLVMEATEAMGPAKGLRWPMEGTFTVVEENSKLAYTAKAWTDGQRDTTEIDQLSELELSQVDGKTHMKLKVTLNKLGVNAQAAADGMQWGYTQQFEKLSGYLAK